MNINTISIEFDSGEGSIRRLLGVIEARGFKVRTMSMGADLDRARMTVGVSPRDGGRCVDILSRQISRLQCVRSVARAEPVDVGEVCHAAAV